MKCSTGMWIALACLAFACGEEKPGADTNGNCDSEYIGAYNRIVYAGQKFGNLVNDDGSIRPGVTESQLLNGAKEMDRACDRFLSRFRGTGCFALNRSYDEISTNPEKIEKACSELKTALNGGSFENSLTTTIAATEKKSDQHSEKQPENQEDAAAPLSLDLNPLAALQPEGGVEAIGETQEPTPTE